jgi:hypothetical protein
VRNKFNRYLSSRIAPERFASLTGGYIPKNGWEVGLDLFVLQHHFSVYRSRQAPFQELHVSACAMPSQQACGPSPFEVLTPDILLYIIQQYLIPNDVVSIACVCRAARVVAIKDDCWLSFLSKGNFPANSKTTGAFELARECLQVNDGGISGVSRNLPDRSLVSFLKRGDVRPDVRVSCEPGNESGGMASCREALGAARRCLCARSQCIATYRSLLA